MTPRRPPTREEVPLALATERAVAHALERHATITRAAALGKVGVGEIITRLLLVIALVGRVRARRQRFGIAPALAFTLSLLILS